MEYLYHGSSVSGILVLNPVSRWHDSPNEKVVHLTSSKAYALVYIWDSHHNHRPNKYVTCGVKDGVITYFEQFPNQLYTFYNNVSGYIYSAPKRKTFIQGSENIMWISKNAVPIINSEFISNVYWEILKYEKLGLVKVRRFNEESQEYQNKAIDMVASVINKKNLLQYPESVESQFFSKYFVQAWKKASYKC